MKKTLVKYLGIGVLGLTMANCHLNKPTDTTTNNSTINSIVVNTTEQVLDSMQTAPQITQPNLKNYQLGSYANPENANNFIQSLTNEGFDVYTSGFIHKGKSLIRVIVKEPNTKKLEKLELDYFRQRNAKSLQKAIIQKSSKPRKELSSKLAPENSKYIFEKNYKIITYQAGLDYLKTHGINYVSMNDLVAATKVGYTECSNTTKEAQLHTTDEVIQTIVNRYTTSLYKNSLRTIWSGEKFAKDVSISDICLKNKQFSAINRAEKKRIKKTQKNGNIYSYLTELEYDKKTKKYRQPTDNEKVTRKWKMYRVFNQVVKTFVKLQDPNYDTIGYATMYKNDSIAKQKWHNMEAARGYTVKKDKKNSEHQQYIVVNDDGINPVKECRHEFSGSIGIKSTKEKLLGYLHN